MRVSTAFNRMLDLTGASVQEVEFTNNDIIVNVRLRKRRALCPCGQWSKTSYDKSSRRWRHLDLAASKCWIQADIRRIDCKGCGKVRTEEVPWARPNARHTRDFEDTIGWLCQRTDRTTVTRLMRVSWRSVTAIVERVVADHLDSDRLNQICRIGVDEISYKVRRYLTVVCDHDTSSVVHISPGRTSETLNEFFELLGPARCKQIEVISMDMAPMWKPPCEAFIPDAVICFDPFHVMAWVNHALDAVYNSHRNPFGNRRIWQQTRTSLRTAAESLSPHREGLVRNVGDIHRQIGHAWALKEEFRDLYRRVDSFDPGAYLRGWVGRARASGISQFVVLARRIENHFEGIVASVEYRLSNALAENLNARIRLVNKRGFGHHSARSLSVMIYLCLGGITLNLPT